MNRKDLTRPNPCPLGMNLRFKPCRDCYNNPYTIAIAIKCARRGY